jgi:hypothetical protein
MESGEGEKVSIRPTKLQGTVENGLRMLKNSFNDIFVLI